MNPTIAPLYDDAQRALEVLTDLNKFCQHFRIGIQPRADPLRIAIVEPHGEVMWKHSKQTVPMTRAQVTGWTEITQGDYLHGQSYLKRPAKSHEVRVAEILDAIAQCLRHYNSCLVPMPIDGEPMMILCEEIGGGQRRAYAVVAELDCYGFKDRPVKPRVTQ